MKVTPIVLGLILLIPAERSTAQMTQQDSVSIIRSVAALLLGRIQPVQRDSVAVLDATGNAALTDQLSTELAGLRGRPTTRVRADSQKTWGVYRASWAIESAKLTGERPVVVATILTTAGSGASPACAQFFKVGEAITLVRNGTGWRVSSFRSVSVNSGMCSPG